MACQNRIRVARASVSKGKGDDVAGSAAHCCPHPPFVLVLLHTTPAVIQFEHVVWCSLAQYSGFGVRTREVPQSLPWSSSFPHRLGPFLTISVLSQTRQACVLGSSIMTPMIAHH